MRTPRLIKWCVSCQVRDGTEDAVATFHAHLIGWRAFILRHPEITTTILRTDGASCYSGVLFAKLLCFSRELCGMKVVMHLLGEGVLGSLC